MFFLQREVLDELCVTEMAVYYGMARHEVRERLSEWKFDYLTATYLLLQNKKLQGRPVRLGRPKVLQQRQNEIEQEMVAAVSDMNFASLNIL